MLPTATGDIPILPLALEGPYGASNHLPDLTDFDNVLLVAGGVGATFAMPIYRAIAEYHDTTPGATQVRFIWAVQKLADTQWAFPDMTAAADDNDADDARQEAISNGLLNRPCTVEVYVTRSGGAGHAPPPSSSDPVFAIADDDDDDEAEHIELQESEQLLHSNGNNADDALGRPRKGMTVRHARPHMGEIVDEVFSRGMRTAVLCCGPKRLTAELKRRVEVYVKKGNDVYWYDETFGW